VATLGGNLCQDTRCVYYNQSAWWRKALGYCLKLDGDICHVAPQGKRCRAAFCSDLAPALMVHEAQAELVGPRGRRRLALTDLYSHDGAAHLRSPATKCWPSFTCRRRPRARPTPRRGCATASIFRWPAWRWRCTTKGPTEPACGSPPPASIRARC
jgi:hypothetical protein